MNNFATCSQDRSIKTWIKNDNTDYILNKSINNAHEDDIHKIEFLKDNTIISGSKDATIKIFNLVNTNYVCSIILIIASVYIHYIFKKKNLLMSAGTEYTIFWNLTNVLNPFIAKLEAFCHGKNAFQLLDKNRIVIGGRNSIQIISIEEKKIMRQIESEFLVWAISVVENKNLFICGGVSTDISIYSTQTYEILGIFKECHEGRLRGIYLLKNGKIITGSEDKKTKIWGILFE